MGFDVMGGTSVAFLGYNVVRIICKSASGDAALPTGFNALCILPPIPEGATAVLDSTKKKVTISGATVGDVIFVIGQN